MRVIDAIPWYRPRDERYHFLPEGLIGFPAGFMPLPSGWGSKGYELAKLYIQFEEQGNVGAVAFQDPGTKEEVVIELREGRPGFIRRTDVSGTFLVGVKYADGSNRLCRIRFDVCSGNYSIISDTPVPGLSETQVFNDSQVCRHPVSGRQVALLGFRDFSSEEARASEVFWDGSNFVTLNDDGKCWNGKTMLPMPDGSFLCYRTDSPSGVMTVDVLDPEGPRVHHLRLFADCRVGGKPSGRVFDGHSLLPDKSGLLVSIFRWDTTEVPRYAEQHWAEPEECPTDGLAALYSLTGGKPKTIVIFSESPQQTINWVAPDGIAYCLSAVERASAKVQDKNPQMGTMHMADLGVTGELIETVWHEEEK